jgi:serine/threonine protein kinase/formylglycine-generating enzyme required for sulfatase activity
MEPDGSETNLLFGILAVKMNFIGKEDLFEAMGIWFLDRRKTLGEILVGRDVLTAKDCELLDTMVQESRARAGSGGHRDNPEVPTRASESIRPTEAPLPPEDHPEALTRASESIRPTQPPWGDWVGLPKLDVPPEHGELTVVWPSPRESGGDERFVVLRPHAKGGIGKVSVALDVTLSREVALKELLDEHLEQPDSRARFQLEAEVTARLEHPGIVPVYAIGRNARGEPFYVMRFIKGESFKDAVRQFHAGRGRQGLREGESGLGLQQLLRRFIDVCDTIEYAHSRGVIHRDLKPSNVVVGKYGETLVVDWGLAKFVGRDDEHVGRDEPTLRPSSHSGSTDTIAGVAVGTPAFMSPEQAEGDAAHIGYASDIYGLGATLYYLLTGRNPIADPDVTTALRRARRGEYRRPREVDSKIPAALEAICLKAMSHRRDDRYGSARQLAHDVELWLADEPVSAWSEPARLKLRRWVSRNRTLVSSAAAAILVAATTGGYLAYEDQMGRVRRQVEADARVEALSTAEIRALPQIVDQLGDDRTLVRDRLRALLADGRTVGGQVGAAMALLPDDPSQARLLFDRAVAADSTPEEVLVIRDVMMRHGALAPHVGPMIAALSPPSEPLDDAGLRRLGLLAAARADWSRWPEFTGPIAARLVRVNPAELAAWRRVFQPIGAALDGPLRAIYADRSEREPRALAFSLLLEFASRSDRPDRPEALAGLLTEADPDQFQHVLRRLASREDRARALAVIVPLIQPLAHRDLRLAERQSRLAPALLALARPDLVWPMLAHREDPTLRTEVIHLLPGYGIDPTPLVDRLRSERDPGMRRALIVCLGGFAPEAIPPTARAELRALLRSWYGSDPDAGIHGAIDWVLRIRWGDGGALDDMDRGLRSPTVSTDRGWYVNPSGHTFALVRGPVTFRMGTVPGSDPHAGGDESLHEKTIGRSFAIGMKEISLADFRQIIGENPDLRAILDWPGARMRLPTDDCAAGAVSWFDAARYCNWLSAREGIPEDQWCYPRTIGVGMVLPADALERMGYRVPTEAEWEYACRAGATTIWPHGLSESRVNDYAWTLANAGRIMHPPGLKPPNDMGMFDILGNASEWCIGLVDLYRDPNIFRTRDDTLPATTAGDGYGVDTRGGSFLDPSADIRPANRNIRRVAERLPFFGFRLARTCPK